MIQRSSRRSFSHTCSSTWTSSRRSRALFHDDGWAGLLIGRRPFFILLNAVGDDGRERIVGDPAVLDGVAGRGEGIVREHHGTARGADLVDQQANRVGALGMRSDVPYVGRANAPGKPRDGLTVDLGILLAAVTDQDEGQGGIGLEYVLDGLELVRGIL